MDHIHKERGMLVFLCFQISSEENKMAENHFTFDELSYERKSQNHLAHLRTPSLWSQSSVYMVCELVRGKQESVRRLFLSVQSFTSSPRLSLSYFIDLLSATV